MRTLVLGGVKSGKSRFAEQLAIETGKRVVYVATAHVRDEEMRARVEMHRQSRPADWQVLEEPLRLVSVLSRYASGDTVVLVDCLTLWLTNLLCDDKIMDVSLHRKELASAVGRCSNDVIMVSNETNMGVHPMGDMVRRFCDEAGLMHQALARQCDTVVLTVAGLPHILKSPS